MSVHLVSARAQQRTQRAPVHGLPRTAALDTLQRRGGFGPDWLVSIDSNGLPIISLVRSLSLRGVPANGVASSPKWRARCPTGWSKTIGSPRCWLTPLPGGANIAPADCRLCASAGTLRRACASECWQESRCQAEMPGHKFGHALAHDLAAIFCFGGCACAPSCEPWLKLSLTWRKEQCAFPARIRFALKCKTCTARMFES
eukprot:3115659-Pyramimonas_sp.AAC.1